MADSNSNDEEVTDENANESINTVTLSVDNAKYEIFLPNASTDYIQQKITTEQQPYELSMLQDIKRRIGTDDLVLDIGANIGNHTLYLVATTGCDVVAFEPNQALSDALLSSVELNGFSGHVTVHSFGLGKESAQGHFASELPDNLGAQSIELGTGDIQVVSLDSLNFKNPVKLIKIDVEGMELQVLQGGETLLRKDRPILYVECQTENEFKSIENWLDALEYSYWDTFNATPTHLFRPNEQVDLKHQITRLQLKDALDSYKTRDQLTETRSKLNDANKKYREVHGRIRTLEEKLAQETSEHEQRLNDANQKYNEARELISSLEQKHTKRKGHYKQLEGERQKVQDLERKLGLINAEIDSANDLIKKIKSSATYQAGHHVRNARSFQGIIRLPLALYRVYKTHNTRKKKLTLTENTRLTSDQSRKQDTISKRTIADRQHDKECNESNNLKIKSGVYGWPPIDKHNEKPTVLAIMDEFTAGCFRDDANLIQPRPDNWEALIKRDKPSLIFIESAWKGNYGSWQYRVAKYTNKPGDEVTALSEYGRANGISVVFWNKEDPVHHDKFMDSAKLADVIFTTDANMVKSYNDKTGNKQVYPLPFAAQPGLHKPSSLNGRIDKTCFAGSWYGGRHVERGAAMQWLLKAAKSLGLDIYDRNYGTGVFPFPDEYRGCIKGSLPYEALCKEYRRYRVFMNVNSVTTSPTMFSRRVFELLACGTPVVSTYSQGIDELLGTDAVWLVEDEEEATKAIQTLLTDDDEWRRRSLLGIRKVFTSHTYMHRLQYIYEKVGIKLNDHLEPSVMLTARVNSHTEFKRLVNFATNQSWKGFTLYVEQPSTFQATINYPPSIKPVSTGYFASDDFKQLLDGNDFSGWINPDAEYGSYYLQDLINATRYAPDADGWGKASTHVEFEFDVPVYVFAAIQRTSCLASNNIENPIVGSIQGAKIYCLDREEYKHAEVKPSKARLVKAKE